MSNNYQPSVLTEVTLRPSPARQVRKAAMRRFSPKGKPVRAVVQLDEQAKEGGKVYTRRYVVVELDLREKDRVFRVIKPVPDHLDPYYTKLSCDAAVPDECTCTGFEKSNYCSHVESLRTLINKDQQCQSSTKTKKPRASCSGPAT